MSRLLAPLKQLARTVVGLTGRQNWVTLRPNLIILTYHRVLPATDARARLTQPGMMVTPETFAMHLRELKRKNFVPMPLHEWVADRDAGRRLPRKACAITFDDGWRDNYEFAFPILSREQLPATVFLVTDKVGTPHRFWPERLANLVAAASADVRLWSLPAFAWFHQLHQSGAPMALRDKIDYVICQAKRFNDDVIEQRIASAEHEAALAPAHEADLLNWIEVAEMRRSSLVSFGSHTRRHTRLVKGLASTALQDEIVGSKHIMTERLGEAPPLFCYPNGDASVAAETLVRGTYRAACVVTPGWNNMRSDVYRLKRLNMHNDVTQTPIAFSARLSGWN